MDTTKTTQDHTRLDGCVASATGECIAKNNALIASAPNQNKALIWVAEWMGIRKADGEKPNRADVVRIVNEALSKAGKNE